MILKDLCSYYDRLSEDTSSGVAGEGFAPQQVQFALEISNDGELVGLLPLGQDGPKGKKKLGVTMLLPSTGKMSAVAIAPKFLWHNAAYIFGRDGNQEETKRAKQCREAFYKLHHDILGQSAAAGAKALLAFLGNYGTNYQKTLSLLEAQGLAWGDFSKGYVVFRFQNRMLHENGVLGQYWPVNDNNAGAVTGTCLITGEKGEIARLHPPIKGVKGGQPTGVALCSYNLDAFCSYGLKQNMNGPVSVKAAFKYTTALNYLLKKPGQHITLGNTTVVLWAERPSALEEAALGFYDEPEPSAKSAAPAAAQARMNVLRKLVGGLAINAAWPGLDEGVEMHMLGVTPNASRLAVSFYLTGPAKEFLEGARAWYSDLNVAKLVKKAAPTAASPAPNNAPPKEFFSVYDLARAALGPHKKLEDVTRVGADLLKAALAGGPYPAYLLPMCLNRLRAGDPLYTVHAALIKASLIRNFHKEVDMSLNKDHPSAAYQLGRLFALLAALQRRAIGNDINAGIKEKYFGSASATPSLVFPQLIRNAQNHISKAKAGTYDRLIGEVLNKIDNAFPKHLSLEEQGLFALGYYHQMADRKADDTTNDTATQGDDNGNDK